MRVLGEECDWSIQCQRTSMDSTKACLTRKCQCSSGYIPIDAYRCIHDFGIFNFYSVMCSLYQLLYLAMPLPNKRVGNLLESEPLGFGSACSIDRDCQRMTTYLECIHGKCICKAGHVPLGKYLCFNLNGHGKGSVEEDYSSNFFSQVYH